MHPRQSRSPELDVGPRRGTSLPQGLAPGRCLWKERIMQFQPYHCRAAWPTHFALLESRVGVGGLGGGVVSPLALPCKLCHTCGWATWGTRVSRCAEGALEDFSRSSAAKGKGACVARCCKETRLSSAMTEEETEVREHKCCPKLPVNECKEAWTWAWEVPLGSTSEVKL